MTTQFPVYLDITVGGKSKEQLLRASALRRYFVEEPARDLMSQPEWKPGARERVRFARARIIDLGLKKHSSVEESWARVQELGHSLCEPCDGPAIRLALNQQEYGDYFWCLMKPISSSYHDTRAFCVGRLDGKWRLFAWYLEPGHIWSLGNSVVFRLGS